MNITRGEIWLVSADATAGGKHDSGPAVVVTRDSIGVLPVRVTVPVTAWQNRFEGCDWLVRLDPDGINGLDRPSAADTVRVQWVSAAHFVKRLGQVTTADMARIADALRVVLNI